MSAIPEMSGMQQVVLKIEDQEATPIAAADAMKLNDVRLSKNQKLRMAHKGAQAVDQTWVAEPSFGLDGGTYKYIAPEARPNLALASTDDGVTWSENGTFTEGVYQNDASSTSANDGLIGPDSLALAADAQATIINDMPGRMGGPAQTSENYLSIPGNDIVTSLTFAKAFEVIQGYNVDGDASALTILQLEGVGIPVSSLKSSKLAAYKVAIVNATAIESLEDLCTIIVTVNNA